jgi:subtilase family serine protease
LANLYDPKNASYKHQLSKGKFYARFAPASEQSTAISDYLQESGLHGLRLFL